MKRVKKIISIMLVFAILIQYFPVTAYAKTNTDSDSAKTEEAAEVTQEAADATIVKEIVEMRELNKKYFEMSDGSTMVALYNENIHYETEDGTYEEIDSSLTEEDDEYINSNSDYSVKFAKKSNTKKLATLTKNGNKISWHLDGQKKIKMKNITLENDEEDIDSNLLVGNAHSRIEYQNILDGITLRYDNSGSSIKESIIAYYKEALEQELTFTYDVGNLEIVKNEDNSINIVNPETGEVVYYIDSLFMYDDNGVYSSDIEVNITKEKDQYKITLVPNEEWINDESRSYPVVIDPSITTSQDYTQIDDTFVYNGDGNSSASTRVNADILRIGSSSYDSMNHASGRALIKFNLPTLTSGDQIVNAKLYLASYPTHAFGYEYPTSEIEFDVHKMTQDWNGYNAYFSNIIDYDTKISDYIVYKYDTANPIKFYDFNITDIVKDWYITGNNYGVMIREKNEISMGSRPDAYFFSSDCAATYAAARPIITIAYRNQTGLEDYMTYQTDTIGKNTVNTNNYNGNLVLNHNDISTTGNLLPAAIYHTYNTNDKNTNIGYGNGFRLNYNQTVQLVTIGSTSYAKYIDEDGTTHYFNRESDVKYTDEDGLNLTLTLAESVFTMTDKAGNRSEFTNYNGTYNLTKIIDTNNNEINITYTGGYITGITDGAGKSLTLVYTNNLLTSIVNNVTEQISYSYNGTNLSIITYADNTTTQYTYSNNLLTSVGGFDYSRIEYDYYPGPASRVRSIVQHGTDNYLGNTLYMTYLDCATKVVDNKGRASVYTFDSLGRTISITSGDNVNNRYGTEYKYGSSTNDNNKLTSVNNFVEPVTNLLINSSFEKDSNWTLENQGMNQGTCSYDDTHSTMGNRSAKCTSNDLSTAPFYSNKVTVRLGYTYTLSFKVKTDITSDVSWSSVKGAFILLKYYNSLNEIENFYYSDIETDGEWETRTFTFTMPSDIASTDLYVLLGTANTVGSIYYDEVQLEEGEVANPYNIVENSSFDLGTTSWDTYNINPSTDNVVSVDDNNSLQMYGVYNIKKWFRQSLSVKGDIGDTYVISGYVKSRAVPNRENSSTTSMAIELLYQDGTSSWVSVGLDSSSDQWQYFSQEVKFTKAYKGISAYLCFYQNNNEVYFDDINMFKDISGNAYTYDASGNLISASNLAKENSKFTYDANNQLMSSTTTNGSKYSYEYDATYKNRIIKGSSYDLTYLLDYDSKGNNTKVTISSKDTIDEIVDGEYYIRRNTTDKYLGLNGTSVIQTNTKEVWTVTKQSNGYYEIVNNNTNKALDVPNASTTNQTNLQIYSKNHSVAQQYTMVKQSDGSFSFKTSYADKCVEVYGANLSNNINVNIYDCNNTVAQKWYLEKTDASSKYIETAATYDATGDFLTGMSNQKGNTTSYTYNDKGLVSSITNPNNVSTEYSYAVNHNVTSVASLNYSNTYIYNDYNQLWSINYNDITYGFDYDGFGNNTGVYINNSTVLAVNEYEPNNGNLTSTWYGNGSMKSYTYDSFDRLTSVSNQTGTIDYVYDNMNNLAITKDSYNNANTYYKYDISKRLLEINHDNNFKVNYNYDTKSNINKLEYALDNTIETIKYANNYIYDNDNKITKVTNNLSSEVSYSYDELSRVDNVTYKNTLDNSTYNTNYTYEDVDSDKTTTSIKKIETNNNTYEYTYDSVGNITEIKKNDILTNKYYYDGISQLIKEDDILNNETIEYIYDNGGNLAYKDHYTYNTTNLIKEDMYAYYNGRTDELFSYNDEGITYDSIGNPLTIGTKTLNWVNGRQLQSITDGSNTYSYKYNEDGIRTSKTVNGVTTNYKLQGSNIIFEQTNDNMIYYIYDASSNVIGLKYNNDIYYYEKNIQNDITGIMDDSFNLLATYEYDSWGNIKSIKDINGNTITDGTNIALVNPFRYRSYYYDSEIGMYYLNSRYYNSEWGRFINADNYVSTDKGVLGHNMYAYCNNNPIVYTDPEGHFIHIGLVITIAIVGTLLMANTIYQSMKAKAQIKNVQKKAKVPDKTNELNNTLQSNAASIQKKVSGQNSVQKMLTFANETKTGSTYDIKIQEPWKNNTISYNGLLMDAQDVGNFNFGYIGRSIDIPTSVLTGGAGAYQFIGKNSSILWCLTPYNCDDPRDNYYIRMGAIQYDATH